MKELHIIYHFMNSSWKKDASMILKDFCSYNMIISNFKIKISEYNEIYETYFFDHEFIRLLKKLYNVDHYYINNDIRDICKLYSFEDEFYV